MTRYTPQWLQAGSYPASLDRRLIGALWPSAASSGCAVTAATGMAVNIAAGQVAVPSQNNTGSSLCTSDAVEQATLTAAPASGQSRIDLIVCQPRGADLDGGSNTDFLFTNITGTAAPTGSQTVPATPAGSAALAQILVPGGSASVVAGNITDVRPGGLAVPAGVPANAPRGFIATAIGPASQTDVSGQTVVLTLTAPLVAGRRYRVTGQAWSIQQTSTGNATIMLVDTLGLLPITGNLRLSSLLSLVATGGAPGVATWTFTATASGNDTFNMTGQTSAGTLRFPASSSQIVVEDIGV